MTPYMAQPRYPLDSQVLAIFFLFFNYTNNFTLSRNYFWIKSLTSQTFLFYFPHTIAFLPVFQCLSLHMFELVYVFTFLFLCFHSFTIFPSECAPTWLRRKIYKHSFSRLASAQFPDSITCTTSQSSAELATSLSN